MCVLLTSRPRSTFAAITIGGEVVGYLAVSNGFVCRSVTDYKVTTNGLIYSHHDVWTNINAHTGDIPYQDR